MNRLRIIEVIILIGTCLAVTAAPLGLESPNGRFAVGFGLKNIDGAAACAVYNISYDDKSLITDSRLGLNIKNQPPLSQNFEVLETSTKSKHGSWTPVCGTRSAYPDRFNELRIDLIESAGSARKLSIIFRAYDEGVAFRYVIPAQAGLDEFTISEEATRFVFPADYSGWFTGYPQGLYDKRPISKMQRACRPLVIEAGDKFVAIAEAGSLEFYTPMVLSAAGSNALQTEFRKGTVNAAAPVSTPWRVVMAADTPGDLVERHYLIQNLNAPCAIADTSWIRPGKVWRNTALNRENSDMIVDYNAAHNYQFVHWDTGWNGQEYDDEPDHPTKILPGKDLLGAIEYAHENGQGFVLYVNHQGLEAYDLDDTFSTYNEWGVDGVKFGFVNYESHAHMAWLHKAMRKAAEYELMVNIHDNYRPTGYERTYPNLMTFEGIAGNETRDDLGTPANRLVLAFTRTIAGAADFTPCYFDPRVESRAFQLACAVVFYSPWQYIHWYDRPNTVIDKYGPGLEFWEQMPAVWDESIVLEGAISDFITIARRSGDDWFVSSITDEARTSELRLSFLDPDKKYAAEIYKEDPDNKLFVAKETRTVTANDIIHAKMSSGSGYNIILKVDRGSE
ncbi:MAG: glycoside hydrolase family 97 protein [Verrucomicrobia bacterium]|nr:glycoside hydrolase family 97 protein [Verrucomicrobiota bacterium]